MHTIKDRYEDPILDDMMSREVIIDNRDNSNELEDYQVDLAIDEKQLFFEAQDGLRFVDEKLKIISHWNESFPSKEWLKVPKISASAMCSLRMLDGFPSVSSGSNGINTFLVFNDLSADPSIYGQSLPANNYFEWDNANERIKFKFSRKSGSHWYRKFWDLPQSVGRNISMDFGLVIEDNQAPNKFGSSQPSIVLSDTNNCPDTAQTKYNKYFGLFMCDDSDVGADNSGTMIQSRADDKSSNFETTYRYLSEGATIYPIRISLTSGGMLRIDINNGTYIDSVDASSLSLPSTFSYVMYRFHDMNESNLVWCKATYDDFRIRNYNPPEPLAKIGVMS